MDAAVVPPNSGGVNRTHRLLLASNAADAAGRSIVNFAIPVLAVAALSAHADAIGLMNALQTLPFMLLGIPIGYLADRIAAGRLISLAAVLKIAIVTVLLAVLIADELNLALIYVAATLIGVASVASESGQTVAAARLADGASLTRLYAKLQSADSAIGIIAPAAAGLLIGYTAAGTVGLALAAFALSLVAALFVSALPPAGEAGAGEAGAGEAGDDGAGPTSPDATTQSGLWAGLAETFRNRIVRNLTLVTMITNAGLAIMGAVEIVFILRTLGLAPWVVGLTEAFAGVGGVIGASLASRLIDRYDLAAILKATSLGCLAMAALLPLAAITSAPIAIIILCVQTLGWGVAMLISNIAMTTWSVSVIDGSILGRTAAAGRTLTMGIVPIASVVGGVIAVAIGIIPTILAWVGLTALASVLTLVLIRREASAE